MEDSAIAAIINYLLRSTGDSKLLSDDAPVRVDGINVLVHILSVSVETGKYDASLVHSRATFLFLGNADYRGAD
jgi:hypothetical protein